MKNLALKRVHRELLTGTVGLFSLFWILRKMGLGLWATDLGFLIIALLLWLGRHRRSLGLLSLGIVGFLILERRPPLWGIPLLLGFWGTLFLWGDRPFPIPPVWSQTISRTPPVLRSALKIIATVFVFVGIVYAVLGPLQDMVNPVKRRARLLAVVSPPPPVSPDNALALRLRGHVENFTVKIGERAVYQFSSNEKARTYIENQFQEMGGTPERKSYFLKGLFGSRLPQEQQNIELNFPTNEKNDGIWLIGAHWDSAPGTLGADDNASGVAVLLELGRLLLETPPKVPVRLVAFGTEEPPSFGTLNMGSAQCALALKKEGVPVAGMISLEMLGYYNDRPESQLYPPLLDRYYPPSGNFVSLVSNFSSRGLLRPFVRHWPKEATVPLETVVLPGPLGSLALSDQLNFWDAGFPAVMLSDTAYFRNPHYHQGTDTLDTLDFNRMAAVTQALAQVIQKL